MSIYRVWIQQINADMIDVSAQSEDEAKAKAIRQWRRETAEPCITCLLYTSHRGEGYGIIKPFRINTPID